MDPFYWIWLIGGAMIVLTVISVRSPEPYRTLLTVAAVGLIVAEVFIADRPWLKIAYALFVVVYIAMAVHAARRDRRARRVAKAASPYSPTSGSER